jgi:hypothetical protein
MSELVGPAHYTIEQKVEAATHYAVYGSYSRLQRDLGIPKSTSCTWNKNQDETWVSALEQARTETKARHISHYHRLTDKALEAAERGIDELDGQDLKPNDIKALVVAGATCTDKARLIRGEATSISKSEGMEELKAKFAQIELDHRQIERDHRAIQGSVVATQVPENDNNNDDENGSH